jgi:hypothetical protein
MVRQSEWEGMNKNFGLEVDIIRDRVRRTTLGARNLLAPWSIIFEGRVPDYIRGNETPPLVVYNKARRVLRTFASFS